MEAAGGTVWMIGGTTADQKFMKLYLEKYGYSSRMFYNGEECLEYMALAPDRADIIMIMDELSGQIDADRTKYVISHVEPEQVVVQLSITKVLAMRQKEYSQDGQKVETIQGLVNPALKRLTEQMIRLCEKED